MNLIVKVIFIIASVMYPLLLWVFGNIAWIHILMAITCVGRAIFSKSGMFLLGGLCFVCLAIFSTMNIFESAAFYYPVIINIALFIAFASSLKGESVITRIARQSGGKMDENGVVYTRKLTKIWCGMFVFNGSIAAILAHNESKVYWSIFCGIISYVLIGVLLIGEYILRKFVWRIE